MSTYRLSSQSLYNPYDKPGVQQKDPPMKEISPFDLQLARGGLKAPTNFLGKTQMRIENMKQLVESDINRGSDRSTSDYMFLRGTANDQTTRKIVAEENRGWGGWSPTTSGLVNRDKEYYVSQKQKKASACKKGVGCTCTC